MIGDLPWSTERLILRRFREEDLPAFLAYRNDPLVARYQSWDSATEEEARYIIASQAVQQLGVPGSGIQIAIERKDSRELIGDCYLQVDMAEPRQAELGYTLARDQQGKGYATEAVSCVLDRVFTGLGLHRIIALTDCENAPSITLLERLGFRREGHFLQSYWDGNQWTDEYLYALLKEEWKSG